MNQFLTPEEVAQNLLDILRECCGDDTKLMGQVAREFGEWMGHFPQEQTHEPQHS